MPMLRFSRQLIYIMLNIYGLFKALIITIYFMTLITTINAREAIDSSGIQSNLASSNPKFQTYRESIPAAINIKERILELQCYAKCVDYFQEKQIRNRNDIGMVVAKDNTKDFVLMGAFKMGMASDYGVTNNFITTTTTKPTQHFNEYYANMDDCQNECKRSLIQKPKRGYCPEIILQNVTFQNIVDPFDDQLGCIDNCRLDFDCPDVQKCCEAFCGPVCITPLGLRDDTQLPAIPRILDYKLSRGNKVVIKMQTTKKSSLYFHVEIRFHIGKQYSERKMSPWQWQHVDKIAEATNSRSIEIDVSFSLKPGRWYQIRVAAINAFGFRGYSNETKAFTLPIHPKPPKAPADLMVVSSRLVKSYYSAKILWCPSKSSLPIEKYKVIWSLYLKSKDQHFISNEAFVKDAYHYEIEKLLPNSSYFIQIQAISIVGKRRLKSEKRSILYNTTNLSYFIASKSLKCARNRAISTYSPSDYQHENQQNDGVPTGPSPPSPINLNAENTTYNVQFRMNRRFGMIVQITGFYPQKERVYELCLKDANCEQREYRAIRAKKNSLVFSKLKYNTIYILKAFGGNDNMNQTNPPTSFVFKTPKCENFRKRFPKMHIKC